MPTSAVDSRVKPFCTRSVLNKYILCNVMASRHPMTSSSSFSKKSSVSEQDHENHKQRLKHLLSGKDYPENRICADCHGRQPTWASVNLGVFICLHCSGIHRSLGVHISQVRSTTLDTWLPEQVDFICCVGGNKVMNSFWEAHLPQHFVRPQGVDMLELKRFIIDKYVNKKYCDERFRSHPITLETYHNHALLRDGSNLAFVRNDVGDVSHDLLQLGEEEDHVIVGIDHHIHDTVTGGDIAEERKSKEDEEDIWGDIEWVCDEQQPKEEDPPPPPPPTTTTSASRGGGTSHADILAMFD
jgi:stromal membrane-associated protein